MMEMEGIRVGIRGVGLKIREIRDENRENPHIGVELMN